MHGMDNELDTFTRGNSDLEKATGPICTDQHHDITGIEHTDWVPIRMQHVLIFDPVLAGTVQNDGIHTIKLP